nr:MAG TPA: hypothetical protein [Caudoviricetes sp.]
MFCKANFNFIFFHNSSFPKIFYCIKIRPYGLALISMLFSFLNAINKLLHS